MTASLALHPGRPWPLGVTPDDHGANVAVVSEQAERIELCLFDPTGRRELRRVALPERTEGVVHGYLEGLRVGQVYGLRAYGPWDPKRGRRFNPHRLLLDPYARRLTGRFTWADGHLIDPADPFRLDPRDTAGLVPKGVVTALPHPPLPLERPRTPWERTVLYELHLKGMTRLHPEVPAARRGTYLGLAHPAVLDHLVKQGVTTVELMPVTAFLDERRLVEKGLVNYWGYNPYAFFVPEARYASAGVAREGGLAPARDPVEVEFEVMVRALHGAGLEVVLDVVFNHTAETDELGPTFTFRGLDNALYYRLREDHPALYVNDTGCGNTLNTAHPRVLQLVADSLRHWAALGVDGFRFDLGPVLGRDRGGAFRGDAALLQALRQDPVLGRLKLIAEPWDIGLGGYQAGAFPPPFAEWNDRYRDCVRRFWRGDEGMAPELAARLLGSAELFEHNGRTPFASVNFVAAHDGFTAFDSVAYAHRHNEANGEDNRDGHAHEVSLNHGVEGPSPEPAVLARRRRHLRNLLATLFLSQGTPMLAMGDEGGRSQAGNNNAYCQDNPVSWFDWAIIRGEGHDLTGFVARLAALRGTYPVLRCRSFLHGAQVDRHGVRDILWLDPDGRPMTAESWTAARRALVLVLNGRARPEPAGEPAGELAGEGAARCLVLAVNGGPGRQPFRLPELDGLARYERLLATELERPPLAPEWRAAGSMVTLAEGSLQLWGGAEA
jgi:isoamylase